MAYYDFPHTRNYDTDLGYLIEKYQKLQEELVNIDVEDLKDLPDNVATNTTDITKLKGRVSTNENNIKALQDVSNKNDLRITANETNISTLQISLNALDGKVDETEDDIHNLQTDVTTLAKNELDSKTDISDLKSRTSQLETNEKNYLQSVEFESSDIEFRQVSKGDGVQKYSAVVVSSTPVNLNQNLAYANNSNSNLVSSINDGTVEVSDSGETIDITQDYVDVSNGTPHTKTTTLAKFNVNNFNKDVDGNLDLKIDLDTLQNGINTNMKNLAITNNNVVATQTKVTELESEYKTQQETLSGHDTLISNNQSNIAQIIEDLEDEIDITDKINTNITLYNTSLTIEVVEAKLTKTTLHLQLVITLTSQWNDIDNIRFNLFSESLNLPTKYGGTAVHEGTPYFCLQTRITDTELLIRGSHTNTTFSSGTIFFVLI